MSSSASAPVRPAATVTAGLVITAATGSSADRPAATTRERKSRSVRIPSSSPASTTTHVTPAAVMRCAASRIVASGAQTTSGRRTSFSTGWSAGSVAGSRAGASRPRASSDRER
jgi:hypothetical protein